MKKHIGAPPSFFLVWSVHKLHFVFLFVELEQLLVMFYSLAEGSSSKYTVSKPKYSNVKDPQTACLLQYKHPGSYCGGVLQPVLGTRHKLFKTSTMSLESRSTQRWKVPLLKYCTRTLFEVLVLCFVL